MFNTLPSNAVPSGEGGGDAIPDMQPLDIGAAGFTFMDRTNSIEGFLGNGDYITLPISSATNIDYKTNAGVSPAGFPITIANVSAAISGAATDWLGFGFYGSELMAVVINGATDVTVVNIAIDGTITPLGPTVAFGAAFSVTPGWKQPAAAGAGASMTYRVNDAGNIFIIVNGAGMEGAELSGVDGSIVSAPAVTVDIPGRAALGYVTASGVYAAGFAQAVTSNTALITVANVSADVRSAFLALPPGWPYTGDAVPQGVIIQTKGYRTLVTPASASPAFGLGFRFYSAAELDAGIDSLAKQLGVSSV